MTGSLWTVLRLRDVVVGAVVAEERPAIVCDDVSDFDISGLRTTKVSSGQPVVKLIETRMARLQNCAAPEGAGLFLEA